MKCYKAIVSHKRSDNVESMQNLVGDDVVWYVGKDEKEDYINSGAKKVIESGALCHSRNMVLDDAEKFDYSVQFSDDLKRIEKVSVLGSKKIKKEITVDESLEEIITQMDKYGMYLGAVSPTNNEFYFSETRPIGLRHFCLGDLHVVKKCDLRFDENLTLKEDYDYTLQHIKKFGGVCRLNHILPTFTHRVNKGGAVAVRTESLEQENIKLLKKKWGSLIRDNPRRPNEILLNIKTPKKKKLTTN